MQRRKDERPELFRRAMEQQKNGHLVEAVALYERLLQLDDNLAEAHNNLGVALAGLGEFERALSHYDRAIELSPGLPSVDENRSLALQGQIDRANSLIAADQPKAAKELVERIVLLQPDLRPALDCLGRAQHAMGALDDAIDTYQKLLAIAPNSAEVHYNLGNVRRESGDIPGARASLLRATELAPHVGQFHRLLIDSGATVDDSHLRQMETFLERPDALSDDDRIAFHFALGKAYGLRGDYENSFRHFNDGNALARSKIAYDEARVLGEFRSLRDAFSRDAAQATPGCGDPSPVPILIFGMPRSGTTLVEQVLAAHPSVHAGGELFAHTPREVGIFELAMRNQTWIAGEDNDVPGIPSNFPDVLRKTAVRYARYLESLAPGAARVTDKWPFNFKFVGFAHLALPNARLIHVRRDALDTCFSCFATLFSGDIAFARDLSELGRYYRAYEELMAFWRNTLPAGSMLEMQYEDLIADFETNARRLVAYCGLEWNDRCLEFWSAKRPVRTASAVQVRQGLYDRSIGRSQPYLEFLAPLTSALLKDPRATFPGIPGLRGEPGENNVYRRDPDLR